VDNERGSGVTATKVVGTGGVIGALLFTTGIASDVSDHCNVEFATVSAQTFADALTTQANVVKNCTLADAATPGMIKSLKQMVSVVDRQQTQIQHSLEAAQSRVEDLRLALNETEDGALDPFKSDLQQVSNKSGGKAAISEGVGAVARIYSQLRKQEHQALNTSTLQWNCQKNSKEKAEFVSQSYACSPSVQYSITPLFWSDECKDEFAVWNTLQQARAMSEYALSLRDCTRLDSQVRSQPACRYHITFYFV
jgi:hypothetical protein